MKLFSIFLNTILFGASGLLSLAAVLVSKQLDVDLNAAIDLAARVQPVKVSAAIKAEVLEFIGGRLRAWVEEQDWSRDAITAGVPDTNSLTGFAVQGVYKF